VHKRPDSALNDFNQTNEVVQIQDTVMQNSIDVVALRIAMRTQTDKHRKSKQHSKRRRYSCML